MNKSEIAEKAARECMVAAGIRATAEPGKVFMQATCDKFQKIVERAIAESQAPQWISVNEQEPPISLTVICACKDGTVQQGFRGGRGGWFDLAVTHWMKMPDPPKGKENAS